MFEQRPPVTITVGFLLPDPAAPLLGEGLRQAFGGVFRSTAARKIQLNAADGDPGIGLMKMLGGHIEGVFRDGVMRGGEIVDLHSVAIFRRSSFMNDNPQADVPRGFRASLVARSRGAGSIRSKPPGGR